MKTTDDITLATIPSNHIDRRFYDKKIALWDVNGNFRIAMENKPIIALYYHDRFAGACTVENILLEEDGTVKPNILMINGSMNHQQEISEYLEEQIREYINTTIFAKVEKEREVVELIQYQKTIKMGN